MTDGPPRAIGALEGAMYSARVLLDELQRLYREGDPGDATVPLQTAVTAILAPFDMTWRFHSDTFHHSIILRREVAA